MAELLDALKGHPVLQDVVLVIVVVAWLGFYLKGRSAREAPDSRDQYGTRAEVFFGGPVSEALNTLRDAVNAIEENNRVLGEMRTDAGKHADENNKKLDEQTVLARETNGLLSTIKDRQSIVGLRRGRPQR